MRKQQRKIDELQEMVDRLLKAVEGGEDVLPPTTLVTEELSKVQSTLTAHTREMTRVLDDIGAGHAERLSNQEKMYLEKMLEIQMQAEQRLDDAPTRRAVSGL